MQYYSIVGEDVENSLERRQKVRAAHVKRLQDLVSQNRVLISGPNPNENGDGFSGSVMIIQFESLQSAQKWIDEDVYTLAKVYKKVTVKPYAPLFGSAVANLD